MRVLHVYKDYPPVRGGIEHHVQTLATGQAERGHEVEVVVAARTGRSSASVDRGALIIRAARLATLRSTPISPGLIWTAARRPADIVHLHYPHPPGDLAWMLRGYRPPAVITFHAEIVRQRLLARLLGPLMRSVLERAARVVVTSPAMKARSTRLQGCADRVSVVPLGIPEPPEVGGDDPGVTELESRFPGRKLLFVGCLRHYKGLCHLVDAMCEIPATLLVAGDGPLRSELEGQARRIGAASRVRFLGEVDETTLWRLYTIADLLVLPSESPAEAYGLVLVEAMAMGLPVISTELGTGTSWVNRDGETGLVVPPARPAELARAVRALLIDDELRARLGAAARQRARSDLLADRMVDRVLEIYDDVVA